VLAHHRTGLIHTSRNALLVLSHSFIWFSSVMSDSAKISIKITTILKVPFHLLWWSNH